MRIAYVSIQPASDPRSWSGLNLHIASCLRAQGCDVELIGPLHSTALTTWSKARSVLRRGLTGQRALWTRDTALLRHYAQKTADLLADQSFDLLFSPGTEPIAFLPKSVRLPVAFWTDAPFGAMHGYYPWYQQLGAASVREGFDCDRLALQRAGLALYSSDWAAQAAVEKHGADPSRVAVVPFGANTDSQVRADEVAGLIAARLKTPWRFLFVGVEWERKGGDTVLAVVRELNALGFPSELIVVGCEPPARLQPLPDFVKLEGFLDKRSPAGCQRLAELYRSALFFLMPSVAEAYGVVFCEANAHAVPCLSTATGGIPTIIRDGVNGHTFPLGAPVEDFVRFICEAAAPAKYAALAQGAYQESVTRLNWESSGARVRQLLDQLCAQPAATPASLKAVHVV